MSRDCGSCRWFHKIKNFENSAGLCDHHDCRANTDGGCSEWKGIKYDRKLVKLSPEPRYDDVYFEGMKWLDSL